MFKFLFGILTGMAGLISLNYYHMVDLDKINKFINWTISGINLMR